MVTIKHKRGLEKNLPVLEEAELGFVTDKRDVYIGTSVGNIKLSKDGHKHQIADIDQLTETLEAKSDAGHVHTWGTIKDRPSATANEIDTAANNAHGHTNKVVVDRLEDAGGKLVYNGETLGAVYYQSVENIEERDAIPYDQRNEGLLVLVRKDGSSYYLKGGVDNAFWEIFAVGAGGATSASTLPANPSGELVSTNVQSLIDELEAKKLDIVDAYTKAETDQLLGSFKVDYSTLEGLPDLSSLHKHDNKETIDMFSQKRGELTWGNKTFGNMIADIYDQDKDGLIDKAATLEGLLSSITELNYSQGLIGNIQQQINSIVSGAVFKGVYPSYADLLDKHGNPKQSDWVFVEVDETRNGAYTQYYYNDTEWVFGGGATKAAEATASTPGGIKLAGDLENGQGSFDQPRLSLTGVTEGLYKNANIVVDAKGRITHAENGDSALINDAIVSVDETWSSQKVNDILYLKSDKSHTHTQLHDANLLGDTPLDTATKQDKFVVTYNAKNAKAEWQKSQGGKVLVGSKYIEGDYKLIAGSYMNLFIDEVAKTITINSTFRDGVANGVPTLTEITDTILVPAGKTVRLSKEASFNKYMVNVIRLTNSENNVMDISIFEQAEDGDCEYLSNKQQKIHDILYLPVSDFDNTKMIHLALTNYGTADTMASFKIKTTNLI